jgi:subtilisin family serine protease/outer membrane protein assembly factor BamB
MPYPWNFRLRTLRTTFLARAAACCLVLGAGLHAQTLRRVLPKTGLRSGTFSPLEVAQNFRNGRVLAKARDGVDPSRLQAFEGGAGVSLERQFQSLPGLEVLQFDGGRPVKAQIAALMASGLYEFVEPDRIIRANVVPNDPYFPDQWSLNNTGQNGGTPGADIKAEAGWGIQDSAASVIVAVIDSGIRVTHQDLAVNIWKNPSPGTGGYTGDVNGINATFPQSEPGNGDPNDDFFHGTMVAGIIGAAANNSTGIAGVAWSVQMMALKFIAADGFGSGSGEIACIDYAISHNAQIINGSFGGDQPSAAEYYALQQAMAANIIVVAAAGNDSVNADAGYSYPAGYLLDNIVTVAATTNTDTLSSYSDYGPGTVDLAAPGDDIASTFNASDSSYASGSGTSFAAPHVVGALALLKAHFPSDSYRQLINRLLGQVAVLPSLAGKVQSGGRLDLAAALGSTGNGPFNDNFAKRSTLSGSIIQVRNSNVGATLETGEPTTLGGVTVGASLWWTWTAPQSGTYYLDTQGSSYDTVLGVFTGSSVSGLALVASNDDAAAGTTTSHITLNAAAGTAYQIEVAGKNGATGLTALRIVAPPSNDNFANAQVEPGNPGTGTFSDRGVTLYGTAEAGEPNPTGVGGGHSVWYKWTAPATGQYQLAAYSSTLDMVAAVYSGSTLPGLTLLGANNNESGLNTDSLVTFSASAGLTYFFQIDNVGATGGNFTVMVNNSSWQFATGNAITSTPAVGSDGTLYVGSNDGSVYAVNPDGSPRWSYPTSGYIDNASPALASDGSVIVGSSDGYLYALNGSTGALAWRFQASSPISTTAAIGGDGTLYFHDDLNLYALTSAGTLKWQVAVNGHTYSSPVIGPSGTLYVGTPAGLLIIDGTGSTTATLATSSPIDATPAIDADGTVYVATVGGDAYAIHPDGSQKWHSPLVTGEGFTSSPVINPAGAVCIASGSGQLYELSPADGSTLNTLSLPSTNTLTAPAAAGDGTLFIAADDYNVYSIDPASGVATLVGSTAYYVFGSSTLANGYLYFGALDSKLYAFKVGKFPAVTPWPMAHQNPGLTGLASGAKVTVFSNSPPQTVRAGSPLTLNVMATGGIASGTYQPVSYQWARNGVPIPGATSPSYQVASASGADAGTYILTVTSPAGALGSPPMIVEVASPDPGRLINLSARSLVGTGDAIMIAGFVISGSGTKSVLVRGIGPALGGFGVANFLANPQLNVDFGSQTIFSDTTWGGGTVLADTFTQVGAFGLPAGSADSALVDPFAAGAYTALLSGTSRTGVALAEVYDADIGATATRLSNLSVRAQVGTGSAVLIAGFVISGNVPITVLIRGIGPALTGFGVAGAIQQPVLSLYNSSGILIQSNPYWGGEPVLAAAMRAVGAFGLSPSGGDAAMLVTLPPGAYTAQEGGANSTTGVGLIEVYEVQ